MNLKTPYNFKIKGKAKYVLEMVAILTHTVEYKLAPIQWLTELTNTGRRN